MDGRLAWLDDLTQGRHDPVYESGSPSNTSQSKVGHIRRPVGQQGRPTREDRDREIRRRPDGLRRARSAAYPSSGSYDITPPPPPRLHQDACPRASGPRRLCHHPRAQHPDCSATRPRRRGTGAMSWSFEVGAEAPRLPHSLDRDQTRARSAQVGLGCDLGLGRRGRGRRSGPVNEQITTA